MLVSEEVVFDNISSLFFLCFSVGLVFPQICVLPTPHPTPTLQYRISEGGGWGGMGGISRGGGKKS